MSMNTIGPVRWVITEDLDADVHIVYEHDAGYTRTLCGQTIIGGEIRKCPPRLIAQAKCQACMSKVRVRNKLLSNEAEEKSPGIKKVSTRPRRAKKQR